MIAVKNATLQRALVEINDGLVAIPNVRLVDLYPHPSAKGSFVANVAIGNSRAAGQLRTVAEDVYRHTGALVVFYEHEP